MFDERANADNGIVAPVVGGATLLGMGYADDKSRPGQRIGLSHAPRCNCLRKSGSGT